MTKKTSDFKNEFTAEAKKLGSVKSMGQVVGMPDEADWQNIVRIINLTRKETTKKYGFDILVDCITTAKREHQEAHTDNRYGKLSNEFNVVNKDSGMRHIFELPEEYINAIQTAYPTMFSDKDHFHWFASKFPQLRIAEKY